MIELRNVSKIYGQSTVALRNLNLEIRDQEFFVIYGPAGAGKSTTLRLLAGISPPTQGDILRDGVSILNVAPEGVRKLQVATVCLEHGNKDPNPRVPY